MKYISTRGQCEPVSFTRAVEAGLAPDGGLFLPEEPPDISGRLAAWEKLSYTELCAAFFRLFATDMEGETIDRLTAASHTKFSHPDTAPLRQLEDNLWVLELFHGPTLAFKDFALQLLGNLYEEQIRRAGKKLNVLGATSGDTGAAAIHGLLGKEGVHIFILYPDGRVSPLQERQMTCTGAANVFPLAIDGSFDDAQRALKETFGDLDFKARYRLSAVNSINLARILAQCVYYIYAWLRLPADKRVNAEFAVPTGNFGNVLAGWMARQMGLPVQSFKIATNQNDVLHRLFTTGIYELGAVRPSHAPSMDIQVASNFERFLYYAEGRDPARVRAVMSAFKETGRYVFEQFNRGVFSSSRADDAEIESIIRHVYQKYGYIADPHTACAFKAVSPDKTNIVCATAHPAKFPEVIRRAAGEDLRAPALDALKERRPVKHPLRAEKTAIQDFIRSHAA